MGQRRAYNNLSGKHRLQLAAWCTANKEQLEGMPWEEAGILANTQLSFPVTRHNVRSLWIDLDRPWKPGRVRRTPNTSKYAYHGKNLSRGEGTIIAQAILKIDRSFGHDILSDDLVKQLEGIRDRPTRELRELEDSASKG